MTETVVELVRSSEWRLCMFAFPLTLCTTTCSVCLCSDRSAFFQKIFDQIAWIAWCDELTRFQEKLHDFKICALNTVELHKHGASLAWKSRSYSSQFITFVVG